MIILGWGHYAQDIELGIERSHPGLQPGAGAAFAVDIMGEERLVIVQEIKRHHRDLDVQEALAAIRRALADAHELQAYAIVLLKTGSIPKTSSGKIQRHACRARFRANELEA